MNLWYLFLLIPTALLLFVFVFINIWNELIIKDKNEVKEKKMNKKEIIEKLLEKVDELSDKLETLTDKYKQTFKDLEYLKFKQDVKGNMLVTFSNFNIPNGMSLNNFMIYTEYKDETGKEEVVVGTPVYPVLKYLKNNQVIALECKDVITTSIFDKIVVTSFPDNQYIIKLHY